jgi:ATP-dependent DNA helicase RecG
MRPEALFPLFAPVTTLKGVGPRLAPLLAKACGGEFVRDVAFHLPSGMIDRRSVVPIAGAFPGSQVTIVGTVENHDAPRGANRPYRVRLSDETGFITLAWFNPNRQWLEASLPVGSQRVVSGEVQSFGAERQMTHPAYVVAVERLAEIATIEATYPMTAGLPPKVMRTATREASARATGLPEWIDEPLRQKNKWNRFPDAIFDAHRPEEAIDLDPTSPNRMRLAYDELFARQLALQLSLAQRKAVVTQALVGDGRHTAALLKALPYAPTGAQTRSFGEIGRDLAGIHPMARLLQGDVGSGKTLVAAWAMARAAEAGSQSALMAPTDTLARQHARALKPVLEEAGLRLEVLTGREKGHVRARLLEDLAEGHIQALCGTHALFQDDVEFQRLGLVVVDEQHRFGVADRKRLVAKGDNPHLLVMSATPIPRTLALAVHGDLDISTLDEKPPGRKPIATRAMPLERLEEVIAATERAIARDDRVYWVCPLVEESETLDLSAAEDRFAHLQERFGDTVALVHGRLSGKAKDAALESFRSGECKILVATTVIEVGVDVPEASVMVIEHSERFGLAQLHQLRGRVGRGGKPGACLLLYSNPLGETAKKRLEALRATEDGFEIARIDFELRGAGDLLGLRQTGLPDFKLADPVAHADLLPIAHDDARNLVAMDPHLTSPRGQAARLALYLFDQHDAEAFLRTA